MVVHSILAQVTDPVRIAGHERSFHSSRRLHTAQVTEICLIELGLFRVSSQQGTCRFALTQTQKALE